MANRSDEIGMIKSHMLSVASERMEELGTNYSELARSMGAPKSTLSEIFKPQVARLPNVYTLIRLARALDLPVSSLLPPHLFYEADVLSTTRHGSIHDHHKLSLASVTQSILRYGLQDGIYYHPRSIPEFVKPIGLLLEETGIRQDNVESYYQVLQSSFQRKFQGKIVIDEHAMTDLIDRSGIFAYISRRDSLQALDQLRKFCDINTDGVSVHVGSRHKDRLDPVLVLGSSIAISDYFQTLMYIENPSIIQAARSKIVLSCETNPTLSEWLNNC